MNLAFICTAKGLLIYRIDENGTVSLHSKHFIGFSVNVVFADQTTGRWWAGISHKHWGQKLHFSDDHGKSWQEAAMPTLKGEELPNGNPARLRQIWCIEGGGKEKPGVIWLGTDPGALFKSENNGESFELVRSLWNHPSRSKQDQWFGAGSDYPFIHSIVVNPKINDHLYIAVSCAGVFESKDGGKNWQPKNQGLVAAYLPNPHVEIGHDPHLVLMNQQNPRIMWQQNHCGVFVSKDGGENWLDVSVHDGLPNYGFTIMIDDQCPEKAWVIPVESDEQRIAPELKLQVYQTDDFGANWHSVSDGLPDDNVFDIVLRQASDYRTRLRIFGTTSGNVYYSQEKNIRWQLLASHLTKVNFVKIIDFSG